MWVCLGWAYGWSVDVDDPGFGAAVLDGRRRIMGRIGAVHLVGGVVALLLVGCSVDESRTEVTDVPLTTEASAEPEASTPPTAADEVTSTTAEPSTSTTGPTSWDVKRGGIAYEEPRGKLVVTDADGTESLVLLGPPKDGATAPSWSPDGTRIAYQSDRDGNFEVYVMDLDSSDTVRLTTHESIDAGPCWSPDGRQIAFSSTRDGNFELYIMNADGADLRRLTDNKSQDRDPSWSPDGSLLAFMSSRDGNQEVYAIAPDGTGLRNLTDDLGDDRYPSWSPDGAFIAFSTDRDGSEQVYVMAPDGTGQTNITNDPSKQDSQPTWSPDGRQIAIRSGSRIWIMSVEGTDRLPLSKRTGVAPDWSPIR